MPTITVDTETYKRLEALAEEKHLTVEQIAHEALEYYLWEQNNQKISRESAYYRVRHSELKEQYLGRFIVMHQGEVVDDDSNFQVLFDRVRERFGKTAVMITKVEEEPIKVLERKGFQFQ